MNARLNDQVATRGFASMDGEKQRQIARLGGKAAHRQGTAHEFTPEEARAAGRKGGEAVSANRAHMAEIGRRGGEASHARAAANRAAALAAAAAPAANDGATDVTASEPQAIA